MRGTLPQLASAMPNVPIMAQKKREAIKIGHFGIVTCQLTEHNVTGTQGSFKMQDFQGVVDYFVRILRLIRINCLCSLMEKFNILQKMSCTVLCFYPYN